MRVHYVHALRGRTVPHKNRRCGEYSVRMCMYVGVNFVFYNFRGAGKTGVRVDDFLLCVRSDGVCVESVAERNAGRTHRG